jgi:hypothetical protein
MRMARSGVDGFQYWEEIPNQVAAIQVTLQNFQYIRALIGAVHVEVMSSGGETTLIFRFEEKDRESIQLEEYDYIVRNDANYNESGPRVYRYSKVTSSEIETRYERSVRALDSEELDEIRELLRNLRKAARE